MSQISLRVAVSLEIERVWLVGGSGFGRVVIL